MVNGLNVFSNYAVTILSLLATIISIVIAIIKAKKTGKTKSLLSIIEQIPTLVTTAELMFTGSGKSQAKLDYVLTQLRLYALQSGLNVDNETLIMYINSVVEATKNVNVNVTPIQEQTTAISTSGNNADINTVVNQDFDNI